MAEYVKGAPEVVAGLGRLADGVADLDLFGPLADEAASIIARNTPRRSGDLARTVRVLREAKNQATVTAGSARVPYAQPINYGWARRNIRARLFMQTADPVLGPRLPQLLEDGVAEAITRSGLDQ